MKNALLILLSVFIFACESKVDFKNPDSVANYYFESLIQKDYEIAYQMVSTNSKKGITLQDFTNTYKDFSKNERNIIEVKPFNFDPRFPDYRAYEIVYKEIDVSIKDTIEDSYFITTIKNGEEWKILWTDLLLFTAGQYGKQEKYKDAIDLYKSIINKNPLDVEAYLRLGSCYYLLNENDIAQRYIERAKSLRPEYYKNLNMQAAIYNSINEYELAIENYERAISLTKNIKEKKKILTNISLAYSTQLK
jgi:tetratricopeptide (TPR) repeat protein